jgi:helix-turn-helix protein
MELEKYLDKTDLLLYNKILNLIIKDWDGMDTQRLSELLEKLRELHDNLDKIILQRKQSSLFDTGRISKDNENVSISLSELLQIIKRQKRKI